MEDTLGSGEIYEKLWRIAIGVGSIIFVSAFVHLGAKYARKEMGAERWTNFFEDRFSFVVGIPMSAVTAFGLVVYFEITSQGPIEISLWGLVLKGPAGPLMMWVVVFLAIVLGINVLWKKNGQ
jgi:hypothetical protein